MKQPFLLFIFAYISNTHCNFPVFYVVDLFHCSAVVTVVCPVQSPARNGSHGGTSTLLFAGCLECGCQCKSPQSTASHSSMFVSSGLPSSASLFAAYIGNQMSYHSKLIAVKLTFIGCLFIYLPPRNS